jgi:tetratricopeptide (TPR) repeat protein
MMNKYAIMIVIVSIILLAGCQKTDETEGYYIRGMKAEQDMQYETAIAHYAKALTFNRQDALTWYAKGRSHLLLAMSDHFMNDDSDEKTMRIKGNLSKAQDCFRRAQQWGYTASIELDTLQVKLQENLIH